MDTKFLISQLITAVIVIITTVITVRYTQLGKLGISPKHKDRLKGIVRKYGPIVLSLATLGFSVYWLIFNYQHTVQPIIPSDIIRLSFWMCLIFLNVDSLLMAIVRLLGNRKSD